MLDKIGIKTVTLDDEQLSGFYTGEATNEWALLPNSYIIGEPAHSEQPVGPWLWTGEKFVDVPHRQFTSYMFGTIKPKDNDPYQKAYMDSLVRNQLTIAMGPAGSGKSLLALAYAFQQKDTNAINKIVIFTNPWIAESSVKLGFMPGDKFEKLMETSIGSILLSKLGGRYVVENMIQKEELIIMPMGDCRGYEVPEHSFVYFTEAQNTTKYLMKLFLQRTNDTSRIVIEGDYRQVDSDRFRNGQNGLQRAAELFAGEPYAGTVELKTIYRGKIARKAEEL